MKALCGIVLLASAAALSADPVKVVTAETTLRAIVVEVGGDKVDVQSIGAGNQDPHFVDPKPSFTLLLRDADLLVLSGMELEIGWIPPLIDGSRNRKLQKGAEGYCDCSVGVARLEVPVDGTTRADGDVHPLGNPHYLTDPWNARIVAKTIAEALGAASPAEASYFAERLEAFQRKIDVGMFGEALVDEVGAGKLWRLQQAGELDAFLAAETADGQPLAGKLGGWMANIAPARGKRIITYHKYFTYFCERFGVVDAEHIEPKPGISPSAAHLVDLVGLLGQDKSIRLIVRCPYNESKSTDLIAEKTGVNVVVLPLDVGGVPGTDDYCSMMDVITREIGNAYK